MASRAKSAPTVLLVAPDPVEESQARWWRPIAQHWPAPHPAPHLTLSEWDLASFDPAHAGVDAAVLVIGPHVSQSSLFRALDRLSQALVPTMVIDPTDAHGGALADADGATVVLDEHADPGAAASMLFALLRRQEAVDALRTEMRVARRFQGGLRGEIDKIHEELQLAASVQREFLPRTLPRMDRVDLRVLFRPCGYVSGDIYDVQRLDDERLGFFVADAVGHGVPAALMTMVLCRCLVTKRQVGDRTEVVQPSEVLRALNAEMIRRHGDTPRFATAVYGVVHAPSRTVTIAGAGHPHPLRIRAGAVERVETEGGLLGIFPDDQFSQVSFTLADDEMLVVYSDGFETAFPSPASDDYGRRVPNQHYLDRFTEMAQRWGEGDLAGAVAELTAQIDQQSGSLHQVDDLTALLLVPSSESEVDRLFAGERGESSERDATGRAPRPVERR